MRDAQGREWVWAIGEPLSEAVTLEVVSRGGVIDRIPFSPYHVE